MVVLFAVLILDARYAMVLGRTQEPDAGFVDSPYFRSAGCAGHHAGRSGWNSREVYEGNYPYNATSAYSVISTGGRNLEIPRIRSG
jgi:hypothetical protein